MRLFGYLITAAIILFLIGYIPGIKKYLPLKSYYTHSTFGNKAVIHWYRSATLGSFLPYVPVSSKVSLRTVPNFTLKVKSRGGSYVSIKNSNELNKMGLLIVGGEFSRDTSVSLDMTDITRDGTLVTTLLMRK